MKTLLPPIIWLAVVLAAGWLLSWLSGMDYFVSAMLVAGALIVNGLLAEWEDRRPGGFLNPESKNEK